MAWKKLPPIQITAPIMSLAAGHGRLWAGGAGGLASYESSTGWKLLIASLPLNAAASLAYAGGWLFAGSIEGIARSADNGITWQMTDTTGLPYPVSQILPAPTFKKDGNALAATLGGGVLRTETAGQTWKLANFGLLSFDVIALAWGAGETVLAATGDGIYRSTNGGRAWRAATGSEGISVSCLEFLPDGAALAAVEDGGFLRSPDGGATWQPAALKGIPRTAVATALFCAPDGALYCGVAESGTFRSTDGGTTWTELLPDAALSFTADEDRLYLAGENGIRVLQGDAITPLPDPRLHDLRFLLLQGDTPYVAGLHTGLWRWDVNENWQHLEDAPAPLTTLVQAPDGALVASGAEGISRSTDGGITWQNCLSGEAGLVARITFKADGTGFAGSADSTRLLRSRDHGVTWQPLEVPFGILRLAALQATATLLIAATYDSRRQLAQFWSSRDDGDTWQRGAEVKTNWAVVATCAQPPIITLGGMMFMQDLDATWLSYQIGRKGSGIRRLVSDGERTLLALTTTGFLRSKNLGESWTPLHDAPPEETILDIALTNGKIHLLLTDGRVWYRDL